MRNGYLTEINKLVKQVKANDERLVKEQQTHENHARNEAHIFGLMAEFAGGAQKSLLENVEMFKMQ